jgi:flagellar FliL protein
MEVDSVHIRLLPFTLILLLIIALVGVTVFLVLQFYAMPKEAQAAKKEVEQLMEVTSEPLEVTTNLSDDTYIKLAVVFEVDRPETKTELDQRMFQVKDALIALLQNRSEEDVAGEKGLNRLKADLQERANAYLAGGKIEHIYVTERVTQ